MTIARTRVWALTATRSFSIGVAMCAALAVWPAERAGAADWPLRGSLAPQQPAYARWDGAQIGVEVGWGNFRNDFGNSTSPLVAFILRNTTAEAEFAPSTWTTLSSNTTNGPVFGGYIGYNMQWDQLVLGVDLGYKYANIATGANDSISRQFTTSSQFQETVSIDARAQMKLMDYATLRGRAGYAWGQFLPYAFVGAAVARLDVVRSATVSYTRHDIPDAVPITVPPTPPITPEADFHFGPQTRGMNRKGVFAYGYAGGLGLDVALLPNVFVRAEWEYVQLIPVEDFKIHIGSGRVAVGIKF